MLTQTIGSVLSERAADRTVYTSSAKDVRVISRDEGKFGKPTFYTVLARNRLIIAKAYGSCASSLRRADRQQVKCLRVALVALNLQLAAALDRERLRAE